MTRCTLSSPGPAQAVVRLLVKHLLYVTGWAESLQPACPLPPAAAQHYTVHCVSQLGFVATASCSLEAVQKETLLITIYRQQPILPRLEGKKGIIVPSEHRWSPLESGRGIVGGTAGGGGGGGGGRGMK